MLKICIINQLKNYSRNNIIEAIINYIFGWNLVVRYQRGLFNSRGNFLGMLRVILLLIRFFIT